ncbi:hypothetical protein Bca4012_016729 [Brassica carinata]
MLLFLLQHKGKEILCTQTLSAGIFRCMFDGGYREKDARDIENPNIKWEVYIYTGSVDITIEISQDLLRAADQYLLEGLKRLCEYTITQVRRE